MSDPLSPASNPHPNEVFREPLTWIASLSEQEFEAALAILSDVDRFRSIDALGAAFASVIESEDVNALSLFGFLSSLALVLTDDDIEDHSGFVERLADVHFLGLDEHTTQTANARVKQLFAAKGLATAGEATRLRRSGHNNIAFGIFTASLRPFSDIEDRTHIANAVPLYGLRVGYRSDSGDADVKTLSLSLDQDDLLVLKKQLDELLQTQALAEQEFERKGIAVWEGLGIVQDDE